MSFDLQNSYLYKNATLIIAKPEAGKNFFNVIIVNLHIKT
jgi:hypothetical protein